MKKILNLTVWLIIVCTLYWACKKDQTTSNKNLTTEEQELIANAKTYFETNVQNTIQGKRLSDVTDTTQGQFNPVKSLLKSADWSNAYTIKLSIGKIVVAPIQFGDSLYARPESTDSTTRLSINNLSKLIVYKDSAKQLHVEVVTAFPDSNFINNPTGAFSGIAYVQDWQGNFLRAFSYSNGQINELSLGDSLQSSSATTDAIAKPNLAAPPPVSCTATSWYTCTGTHDDPRVGGCVYTHTTNTGCVANDIDDDPAGVNYGLVAGSSGGGGGGVTPTPNLPDSLANFVFLAPKLSVNILDELKCFTAKSNSNYFITLNVEEPSPGSGESSTSSNLAGHAFLTFEQDNADGSKIIRTDGFYPNSVANTLNIPVPSTFGDDSYTGASVTLQITVNSGDFMTAVNSIKAQSGFKYIITSYNCVTSAMTPLKVIGINNLDTYPVGSPFTGGAPGILGFNIRNLNLDIFSQQNGNRQMIRNTSDSNSVLPPTKQGTCSLTIPSL